MMPFTKRYETDTQNLSNLASSKQLIHTNDLCPLFAVNVSFNLDFGKRYNQVDKRLNNSDNNNGILSGSK